MKCLPFASCFVVTAKVAATFVDGIVRQMHVHVCLPDNTNEQLKCPHIHRQNTVATGGHLGGGSGGQLLLHSQIRNIP